MPGVALALLGAAFALLNYASDELSNPALRPVRRRRRAGAGGVAVDVDLNLDLGTPSRHRRQAVRQAKRTRA
jgi:hypothetical protein